MSYRTFKHLLGETSLERKCRFIFGGGILVLVTFSFYWYGQKTERLVIDQNKQTARMLVKQIITNIHIKTSLTQEAAPVVDELWRDNTETEELSGFESRVLNPFDAQHAEKQGGTPFEKEALANFQRAALFEPRLRKQVAPRKPYYFSNGTSMESIEAGKQDYQYIKAIVFNKSCLEACHGSREGPPGKFKLTEAGELAGAVVVKLSMKQTNIAIQKNRAILILTALVTAIVAMFASWTIVRYVIAKPVKHLRDVSDAIAAGKLNVRSKIYTGDEFEELSHAFNRMLHNLVAMQQELREVNNDLDRKVDELAQANMALYEMNRLKSDFLATMSHELRTPLNSIIGFSEVLVANDQLSERQRRYAANILTSGKMLLSMINDLLDLAKIESGKMEIRTEDFSIRDICESLANLVRPVAEKKNIDLECRLDEAIPLLRQDPGKLRQIIYNLLSNSIKFTPEAGRVTLTARAEGRNVVVEVSDTGVGIAEDDRDKIFEKFRQLGQTGQAEAVLTREHQGTGLGLSIVKELTKLLGGDIGLESRVGQGSTFTVRLPLQLPGNRKFEVNVSDERIDLSKARRIEPRPPAPLVASVAPPAVAGSRRRAPGEAPSGEWRSPDNSARPS